MSSSHNETVIQAALYDIRRQNFTILYKKVPISLFGKLWALDGDKNQICSTAVSLIREANPLMANYIAETKAMCDSFNIEFNQDDPIDTELNLMHAFHKWFQEKYTVMPNIYPKDTYQEEHGESGAAAGAVTDTVDPGKSGPGESNSGDERFKTPVNFSMRPPPMPTFRKLEFSEQKVSDVVKAYRSNLDSLRACKTSFKDEPPDDDPSRVKRLRRGS